MSGIADRIRRHLADPESHHRKIAVGFVWVSLFVLIGKLAGAAKEMAIAWRYGISETVDAYVFVFNLVSLPVSLWFSVLTVVLLPLVAKIRNESPADLPRFRGELLGLTLVTGLAFCAVAYWGLPLLFATGWVGLAGEALQQALHMTGPLSLLLPMGLVISLFSAWMMACGRHRNTLLEALPAFAILGVLLIPPGWVPEPLIWGTVAGFSLQAAGLAWPLSRVGELQRPTLGFRSPSWRGFWGSFGIMAAGQALMSVTGIIDQFFAVHLGTGAISTLSYANRILALILGMGAMAISRATLPVFSEAHARRSADVNALAVRWAKWLFVIGLIVLVAGWVVAPWVVGLLFERGAFTAENTAQVSEVLKYAMLQVPFYGFSLTLANLMACQKKYWVLFISGLVGVLVKIPAAAALMSLMQLNGLALSAAVVYCANALLFYYFAVREK